MPLVRLKRLLLGGPLSNEEAHGEKLPKWKALAIFSSDALSSVAYATEEILIPLAAFSVMASEYVMPIAFGIATLILIVSISYRQTIATYPNGGGAYIVAKENLGTIPGLVAGAALLIDYVLTVAVSISAGVAALTSAFPFLATHAVAFGIALVLLIMLFNLRGVRESASIFVWPTYFFIGSFFLLIVSGLWAIITNSPRLPAEHAAPILQTTYPAIPIFLLLRAFASGCAALTGIEAVSNGVPAFRHPSPDNARKTLTAMSLILGALFAGITVLVHYFRVVPTGHETVVSVLARSVFGDRTFFYYLVQGTTMMILVMAANTAYADFPRLASLLARDRFLPRQLTSLGDKLVFSNGIILLSVAAIALIVLFDGVTHHLIPLYAVGVFLSFTLSQTGMIVHHFKYREKGWRSGAAINALGALATFVVLLVIASTKFIHGAWMVILLIPFFVFVFTRIYRHYTKVGRELTRASQSQLSFAPLRHVVIVPVSGIHAGVAKALRYASSISGEICACYVDIDPNITASMQSQWAKWAPEIRLVVIPSPYRSVIRPLLDYIDEVGRDLDPKREFITVLIPEFVTARWYHQILHNQTALLIRAALRFKKNKVVTSVRYHLKTT
jgi:amino acid transporter